MSSFGRKFTTISRKLCSSINSSKWINPQRLLGPTNSSFSRKSNTCKVVVSFSLFPAGIRDFNMYLTSSQDNLRDNFNTKLRYSPSIRPKWAPPSSLISISLVLVKVFCQEMFLWSRKIWLVIPELFLQELLSAALGLWAENHTSPISMLRTLQQQTISQYIICEYIPRKGILGKNQVTGCLGADHHSRPVNSKYLSSLLKAGSGKFGTRKVAMWGNQGYLGWDQARFF